MFRYILTNKLFIGGIVFLIVFSVACVFWYRYDTAPYRQEAAKTAKIARQWDNTQKVNTNNMTEDETNTPAKSNTQSAEKLITETQTEIVEKNFVLSDTEDNVLASTPAENPEVLVSPYGFGPYPPLPPGWRGTPEKTWDNLSANHELIARVQIKLISQGVDVRGGVMKYGKVYPIVKGIRYVRWETEYTPMGEYRYIIGSTGHPDDGDRLRAIKEAKFNRGEDDDLTEADIPLDIKLVLYEKGGVDPYEFLGLTPQ